MNDLVTVFSTQLLSANVKAILAKGDDQNAVFSASEIEAIRPLALARIPAPDPVSENHLTRCLASMAHMPQKDGGITGGRLQLAVYLRMLAKYPTAAINQATERCLRELQFFPSIREISDRCDDWTDPNQYLINRASRILRTGKRIPKETPPLTQDEIDRMSPDIRAFGLASGAIVEIDGRYCPAPDPSSVWQKGNSDVAQLLEVQYG